MLIVFLLIYIDDILIATNYPPFAAELKNRLREHYIVKDLGGVQQLLGIHIKQSANPRYFELNHVVSISTDALPSCPNSSKRCRKSG